MNQAKPSGTPLINLIAGIATFLGIVSNPQTIGQATGLDPTMIAAILGLVITFASKAFPALGWLWDILRRIVEPSSEQELRVLAQLEQQLDKAGDSAGCESCRELIMAVIRRKAVP